MEPEPMLSKKIWTNELKPVPWKKAEVWFMIHEQISTNRKSFRFYYYAAAVLFFMFFNIYQLQQVRIEIVAENNHQPSSISSIQNQPAIKVEEDKFTFTQPNYIDQKSPSQVARVQLSDVLDADSEFKENDIQLAPEEFIINSTEAMAVLQTVAPIVGVIQLPVSNMVSVKPKRKRLFHKLEPAENEFEVGYQNSIIIARIK